MKGFLIEIINYIKKLFLVLIIISFVVFIISLIFRLKLARAFYFTGIVCMIVGCSSVFGNINMASDSKYYQLERASSRSLYQSSKDNLKLRDNSYRFLTFMIILGLLLMFISSILKNYYF